MERVLVQNVINKYCLRSTINLAFTISFNIGLHVTPNCQVLNVDRVPRKEFRLKIFGPEAKPVPRDPVNVPDLTNMC